MRRATLIPWTAAVVLVLSVLVAPAVSASSEDERPAQLGILAGVGFGDEALVGGDNDSEVNLLLGGRLALHFSDRLSGYFDGTWMHYSGDNTLYGDVGETAFRVGPEWYFSPASRWQFFVNMGVGGMKLRSDLGGTDRRGFASVELGARRG